jgi:hypothetical protein
MEARMPKLDQTAGAGGEYVRSSIPTNSKEDGMPRISRKTILSVATMRFCARSHFAAVSALVFAMVSVVAGQSADGSDLPKIIYVESVKAPHRPSPVKIETCLHLLQKEIGVEGKPLPSIVVIHISGREAARFGLTNIPVKLRLHDEVSRPGEPDELWLVGEPSSFAYTLGMSMLLEHHFGLSRGELEKQQVVARVARVLDLTISASAK